MTTSLTRFERSLLQRAIADGPEPAVLERQLAVATVEERRDTGHGLFVEISIPRDVPTLSVQTEDRQLPGAKKLVLSHPKLEYDAGTIVWVSEGCIDCIECFTYGETWPSDDTGFEITEAPAGPGDGASV